jgi:FkbM family methyltransferase
MKKNIVNSFSKEISYCLEMINSLYDEEFKEFKYLYNVQGLDLANNPLDRIMRVLDIFENLVDVNTYGEFTQASVNRIVSQFVNINNLSRGCDKKYSYYLKKCIEQIRKYVNFLYDGKVQPSVVSFILEEVDALSCTVKYENIFHDPAQYATNDRHNLILNELLDLFERIFRRNRNNSANISKELLSYLLVINSLTLNLKGNVQAKLRDKIKSIKDEKLNKNFLSSPGFAQEGEDLILKRLFPADKTGFFLDIGAHHPTRFSNTYLFYRKGWRGITVDPLPGSAELFAEMRPEDIHLQVALGSGEESDQKVDYLMFKEAAYNCIIIDGDEQPNLQDSEIINRIPVVVKSLDSILKENADVFEQIDLLSVDVEGYEEEVFAGFSLEEYLPKVVVIEIRDFDIESRSKHPLYKRLIDNGYKLRSILYNSLIFVHEAGHPDS